MIWKMFNYICLKNAERLLVLAFQVRIYIVNVFFVDRRNVRSYLRCKNC